MNNPTLAQSKTPIKRKKPRPITMSPDGVHIMKRVILAANANGTSARQLSLETGIGKAGCVKVLGASLKYMKESTKHRLLTWLKHNEPTSHEEQLQLDLERPDEPDVLGAPTPGQVAFAANRVSSEETQPLPGRREEFRHLYDTVEALDTILGRATIRITDTEARLKRTEERLERMAADLSEAHRTLLSLVRRSL